MTLSPTPLWTYHLRRCGPITYAVVVLSPRPLWPYHLRRCGSITYAAVTITYALMSITHAVVALSPFRCGSITFPLWLYHPRRCDLCCVVGPADTVRQFVRDLQTEGAFSKEVNSAGVAFHSHFMTRAAPALRAALEKVLCSFHVLQISWIFIPNLEDNYTSTCMFISTFCKCQKRDRAHFRMVFHSHTQFLCQLDSNQSKFLMKYNDYITSYTREQQSLAVETSCAKCTCMSIDAIR